MTAEFGKFKAGVTYYDVWNFEAHGKTSYFVDYFQIANNQVERTNEHFGAIQLDEVYAKIKQSNEKKNLVELSKNDLDELMELRYRLEAEKKAREPKEPVQVKKIDKMGYYDLQQEIEADLFYGAIDKQDYDAKMEQLKKSYQIVDEEELFEPTQQADTFDQKGQAAQAVPIVSVKTPQAAAAPSPALAAMRASYKPKVNTTDLVACAEDKKVME